MSLGLSVTIADINKEAGEAARDLNESIARVKLCKFYLDGKTDDDLTALGYVAGEIANLRSAYTKLGELIGVYEGTAAKTPAEDLRTFPRRIWGLGYQP